MQRRKKLKSIKCIPRKMGSPFMKKTTYLLRKSVHPDQKYHSSKYIMALGCIPEACSRVPGSAAIVAGTSGSAAFVEGVCPFAES